MNLPVYQLKAEFFKTLGHPARIRIVEVLRDGDHSVGDLVSQVGLEPSHLSHQLAVLRRAGVVRSRKAGTTVVYSVSDPRIFQLFEAAKQILASSLLASQELLADLESLSFEDAAGVEGLPNDAPTRPKEAARRDRKR